MTIEQAVDRLQKRICGEKPVQHFCRDDCMHGASECEISLAIEALKKQIPTKIKDGNYAGRCNCGKFVFKDQDFCPKCGQALKWGDLYER